ncbi:putative RNA polymerase protein [Rhizobium phage RHph_I65]|nr:putative RNA polymerase protein [Rhizobium phage RHph_I65]
MPTVGLVRRHHIDIKAPTGPSHVKVGFPAGKSDGAVINRAIWNHYGTRGGASGGGWGGPIPARPFILNTIRGNRRKYLDALKTSAAKLVRGETTLHQVLTKLGIVVQGDIQAEIDSGDFVPNSPTTVAMKGSSRPLIDTGEMRQKVTWQVTDD